MPAKKKKEPPLFRNKQWQECYESWLRAAHHRSGSTVTPMNYRSLTRRFFTDPRKTPDQYTRADVEAYIHHPSRHKGGVMAAPAPSSQNARLAILTSFYSYAANYDVPFRSGVRPLLHTPPPTRGVEPVQTGRANRTLTDDELTRLFAAIPRDSVIGLRDYALLSCYFWCARRRQEILRLRWGDIFECVFVEPGKPPRTGHMYRYTGKGRSRETATAELPPPAWDAIVEYLKAAGRYEHMTPESPLWVRMDNSRRANQPEEPMVHSSADYIMLKYVRAAGLSQSGKQVCLHGLRHTRARKQYRLRKDVREIQQLLGHSSLAHTLVYLAEDDAQADAGAAALYAQMGKL